MEFHNIISDIELSLANNFYANDVCFIISHGILGQQLSDIVSDLTDMIGYEYDQL
jgi:hypothetical protein